MPPNLRGLIHAARADNLQRNWWQQKIYADPVTIAVSEKPVRNDETRYRMQALHCHELKDSQSKTS